MPKGRKLRWIVVLAALAGGLGWATERAYAIDGGGNLQYWATGGGGYCGGKCSPNTGPCCE